MVLTGRKFQNLQQPKKVEFQFLHDIYVADTSPSKIDLIAGVYRTEEGKPWVFPVVRKVEEEMLKDPNMNHEYLPFLGDETFRIAATKLILGKDSIAIKENRAFGVQGLSGCGAMRIGAEFLNKHLQYNTCYIAQQTWDNQGPCFLSGGFKKILKYRYWNPETKILDIDGLIEDLRNAHERSVVLFQPCCHNPTVTEPTREQWSRIADVMEEKDLFPFFDAPYVGFGTGDMDVDAWSIRHFVDRGFELMVAQSFAKIMGLYGERIGNLTIVVSDPKDTANLTTTMQNLVRPIYCSPPKHGAYIARALLTVEDNYLEWKKCVKHMADRMINMRTALRNALEEIGTPGSWEFLSSQKGMFVYPGLTESQVTYLREKHHVYAMSGGRMNLCGLNSSNVKYVASAIKDSIVTCNEKQNGIKANGHHQ